MERLEAGVTPSAALPLGARAARGAVAILARQALGRAIQLAGGVLLARLLLPSDFGVYAIVLFVVQLLGAFGDLGVGAALVQQSGEVSDDQYREVFAVQTLLSVGSAVAVLAVGWPVVKTYGLGDHGAFLFVSLAASLALAVFRSVPSVMLERSLAVDKLAAVEAVEVAAFQATAVLFAWAGWGSRSFGIAAVASRVAGLGIVYALRPWRPSWQWPKRWDVVRGWLGFGLRHQAIAVVSAVKDAVNPLFVGWLMGTTAVGLVSWASAVAGYPYLLVFALQRLFFPTFSRLRERPLQLEAALSEVLFWTNCISAGLTALLVGLAPELTRLVFGPQWLPGVPLLYWFAVGVIVVPTSASLLSLVSSLGRPHLGLKYALLWMGTTWALAIPMVDCLGLTGFGIATAMVHLTNLFFFREVGRLVRLEWLKVAGPSLVAAAMTAAVLHSLRTLVMIDSLISLVGVLAGGTLLYVSILWLVWREELRSRSQRLVRALTGRLAES